MGFRNTALVLRWLDLADLPCTVPSRRCLEVSDACALLGSLAFLERTAIDGVDEGNERTINGIRAGMGGSEHV